MKDLGCARKIDQVGRINLPIDMLRTLDITQTDNLEVFIKDNSVYIKKFKYGDPSGAGYIRSVDSVGHIGIPYDIRVDLGLLGKNKVHLYIDNRAIVIKKQFDTCACCDSKDTLYTVNKLSLCRTCALMFAVNAGIIEED